MELKLLYRGERAGEGTIDMPDQAEILSGHPLALLWVFSIEQVPSIAFGFLVNRDGTVELSQPIILDLSRLGEQYSHFASGRPSVGGRLHIDLNTPNADGYIRGYLNGWRIEGLIHAELHGRDFHGYIYGDFYGVSQLRGHLRAEIDGQGIHGYVRMHGEFLGRGFGEFRLDISQSGLRVDAFGDGPFFRMRLRLDATEKESIVDQSFLWLLISIVRHELGRRATDSLNVSLHSLVLPIDSPVFSALLDIPPDRRREAEIEHLFELARARSLERVMALRAPLCAPPPPYTLIRYPSLQAPTRVFVGKPFTLTIGLVKVPEKGTSGLVVLENLPPDQKSFPIEYEVLSNDFAFVGDNNRGILEITTDERPVYAQLELTPLPIEEEYHLADLIVVFYFSGKRCGTAHRTLLILANETVSEESLPEIELALEKEFPIEFVFGTRAPDLIFEIFKSSNDATSFDCYVRSSHLKGFPRNRLRSKLDLGVNPATYMRNLYDRIVRQQSGISTANCIAAIGDVLYDIAPDCFKEAYWKLTDDLGDKFQTIQIYSDEPWIPWELMRPMRQKEDGTIEKRSFLGVEHSVGRWLNSRAGEPPQTIQVMKRVAIAPNYSHRPLLCAQQEAKWLEEQVGFTRLEPATKEAVLTFLRKEEAQIIHFSGHAKSQEDASIDEILLEDCSLSAFELKSREIRYGLPYKCHPLVFINACESGRTGLTLGGVGGLAAALVDASCSAVIGTLWPVDDKDAFDVVRMFYSYLTRPGETLSIADIMREIRKEFGSRNRDSFLAYTFFGDPYATVVLQGVSARRSGR